MARPSKYSDELVTEICERIADGESLRAICREEGMPTISTIMLWLSEKPEFSEQYARARDLQADGLFDQAIDMLHKTHADNVKVQSAKLNFDIIKWTAGKLAPKKYGERQQIDANVRQFKKLEEMSKEELLALSGNRE